MKIISLGAGVQSSTMALMTAVGELEMPDCAIFADTGWEPKAVYEWLDLLEGKLPYPLHRVSAGNLHEDLIAGTNSSGRRFAAVPFFTAGGGMGRRQCTSEYKLAPIRWKVRELGATAKTPATMLIGISTDEVGRMKPSRVKYITHSWPLIDRRFSRQDCLAWMAAHDYPMPPRSSCLGCPFHGDAFWRSLKAAAGWEWEDTVHMDRVIRSQPGFRKEQYMHRSRVPLDQVDFRSDYDIGPAGSLRRRV